MVAEEIDAMAGELSGRLEVVEAELSDVRKRLEKLYEAIETSELTLEVLSPRILSLRHREEQLEAARDDAERQLEQRRVELPTTEEIKEYVEDFRDFLEEGTIPECKALIRNFVEGIEVNGDEAVLTYTIPISQSTTKTEVLMGGGLGSLRVRWIGLRPFSLDECFSSCAPSSSLNERLWPSGNSDETIRYSWTVGLAAADGGHTGTSN